jgi:hypothetical protein
MLSAFDAIDDAIGEVTRARTRVSKIKAKQVRATDDLAMLKATAHAWFNTHRRVVTRCASQVDVSAIDDHYTAVLNSTAKSAAKKTYLDALMGAKKALAVVRAQALVPSSASVNESTDDLAPDFSSLAGNQEMREILSRRWHECHKCVKADAHLAAIVMMGGLLEALFVARANKMSDKTPLVVATSAPKDKTTCKTLNYQQWMLDSYIKVAHEFGLDYGFGQERRGCPEGVP